MSHRSRTLVVALGAAASLVILGSASAKPTRLGEPTNEKPPPAPAGAEKAPAGATSTPGAATATATRETTRDGRKKPSPECRQCTAECDAKRIHCVPGCGKAKGEADAKLQKCVAYCFNKATFCHRDCQKTKCKD